MLESNKQYLYRFIPNMSFLKECYSLNLLELAGNNYNSIVVENKLMRD